MGARIKALREAAGVRQEELALVARRHGLPWRRVVVAHLETARRHLTAEEWLLLPFVLTEALNRPCGWDDVIGDAGQVALTSDAWCDASALHTLVANGGRLDASERLLFSFPHMRRTQQLIDVETTGQRLWGGTPAPLDVIEAALVAAAGDAEIKAARVLRRLPEEVALAALNTWGRSLTGEREVRLAHRQGEPARRLQALRGHVTRLLLAELGHVLGSTTPGRRTTGRASGRRRSTSRQRRALNERRRR